MSMSSNSILGKQAAFIDVGQHIRDSQRLFYPVEGTVVGIHFPQDLTNLSKREIEYDVQPDLVNIGTITNAPLAVGLKGIVDGDDIILKPAQLVLPSGPYNRSNHGTAANTDGDRVLVQFVGGSFYNPVITHILNSRQRGRAGQVPPKYNGKLEILTTGPANDVASSYPFGDGTTGSTQAKLYPQAGNRFRHAAINGTHIAVDQEGQVFINFKNFPDAEVTPYPKKLVVQLNGKDLFSIEGDPATNSVTAKIGEALSTILVQVGDGSKSVAISEAIQNWWDNTIKVKLEALRTGINSWAPAAGDGGAALKTALTTWLGSAFASYDTAATSTKVKIPAG